MVQGGGFGVVRSVGVSGCGAMGQRRSASMRSQQTRACPGPRRLERAVRETSEARSRRRRVVVEVEEVSRGRTELVRGDQTNVLRLRVAGSLPCKWTGAAQRSTTTQGGAMQTDKSDGARTHNSKAQRLCCCERGACG